MIEVISPGFYSSIQDLGRFNAVEYGVPVSGAMDMGSAKLANSILGNSLENTVIEITMTGPRLQFNQSTRICITGASIQPQINEVDVEMNAPIEIEKNDLLSFGRIRNGFRAYLAVSGGFNTEVKFGSRSMYQGITKQHIIKKGDKLTIGEVSQDSNLQSEIGHNSIDFFDDSNLNVFKGPEYQLLSDNQQNTLLKTEFTVSKFNNRMAYQLEELIPNTIPSIITSPVMPGTVQLTPSGKLIILMRDCQTTGGYPRILQLCDSAINRLSQKYNGSKVRFKVLS